MTDDRVNRRTFVGILGTASLATATSGVASGRIGDDHRDGRSHGGPKVDIIDMPRKVKPGDSFPVGVSVTNPTSERMEDGIELKVAGNGVDREGVYLRPEETKHITFDARIDPNTSDTSVPVTVKSRTDRDQRNVKIKQQQKPEGVKLNIVDIPESVEAGDEFSVRIEVRNENQHHGAQDTVRLHGWGIKNRHKEVSLRPGEESVFELQTRTPWYSGGDVQVIVESELSKEHATVNIRDDDPWWYFW